MKESYWGYGLILLGILVIGVMLLVNSSTTGTTQDYYMLKEVTQASMIDAVDYSYYRLYGDIRISKQKFIENMKASIVNVDKLRDVENININLEDAPEISKAYVSNLDTDNSEVTITLEADESLFNDILKELVGASVNTKGDLLKVFQDLSDGRSEYDSIKGALKQVYQTGYGIVLPRLKDMKLDKPEIIKQGGRFGIKLKAKASSIHLIKVDVESSFEPIIGSELQSKE